MINQCQIMEGGRRCGQPVVASLLVRDEHNEPCTVHVCADHFAEAQQPHPSTLYVMGSVGGDDVRI